MIPDEITIHVTEDDIVQGKRGQAYSCPITLAMRRELFGSSAYCTGITALYFKDENNEQRVYTLPPEARGFIRSFDGEQSVVPFKFTAMRDKQTEDEGFDENV